MSDSAKTEWVNRVLGLNTAPRNLPRTPLSPLQLWREAKDSVDAGLTKMQVVLRGMNYELAHTVADAGLASFTDGLQVRLVAALMEYERGAGSGRERATANARAAVASLQERIDTEHTIHLLDQNPLGVPLTIQATLSMALSEIGQHLAA